MTLPATIYARFSSMEQAGGHSKERQIEACRAMVEDNGWLWSADRELVDEGKSAFTGANRAPGGLLYRFEQQAASGLYRNGHVLCVENLDRISREGYDAILPFLQTLTALGVTVATVDGGRIYPAYERVTLASLIEAVVKAELSREESDKKRNRNKLAQNKKVQRSRDFAADGQHVSGTRTVPAWIETAEIPRRSKEDPLLYRMTLNEQRATLIREIFQLTIEGYGTPAIAKRLNERGEPVWEHLKRRSNNGWMVGNLTRLLLNRAVLGEWEPMNRPRKGEVTSKGGVILNHYPQVIDPVVFAKAQLARQSRRGSSGSWQKSHGNLFSGIAVCGTCGGRMKQEVTVKVGATRRYGRNPAVAYASKQNISYLKCHNALNRVSDDQGQPRCGNRNWIRYEKLERAVLQAAMEFVVVRQDVAEEGQRDALRVQIAERQRFLDEKQKQVDTLVDSFARTASSAIERRMLQLEAECGEDLAAIRALERGLGATQESVSIEEYERRVDEVLNVIDSNDDVERAAARVRVKQSLRGVLTRMVCMDSRMTAVVFRDTLKMVFDNEGKALATDFTANTIYAGPNGEIDWHPDFPDADYQYVAEPR
jgi:DNA invertase Pin-like site-specific DNA recombinase